jgi:hypothetical protein
MSDENDGDYESVAAMADRLSLTGTRRQKYIHEHMTGLGYRMQPTYVPGGDDDDDDDEDSLLPSGRRRHQGRRTGGGRDDDDRASRQRRSRGGDDWYSG